MTFRASCCPDLDEQKATRERKLLKPSNGFATHAFHEVRVGIYHMSVESGLPAAGRPGKD